MRVDVEVDDSQVLAMIDDMMRDMEAPAVEKLVVDAAQIFADAGRANAPVRTGALASSIQVREVRRGDGFVEAEAGPNVPYALRIEFGYRGPDKLGRDYSGAYERARHQVKIGGKVYTQHGHFYMWRAFKERAAAVERKLLEQLKRYWGL